MLVNLYIMYEDMEKYLNGEVIEASDKEGKYQILQAKSYESGKVASVSVDLREIIKHEEVEVKGFINGTFNKFYIQRKEA
ncbi:gp290 [Bacillus phage G]|uniref:Gp290 n=1 Tax=Bacillus phage G TaxID=2884420 RepID=G3MA31_9CAUD|nr:gp290 [Bacillus phage G]AEO93549.1 gp290 [Bacillus phage G]